MYLQQFCTCIHCYWLKYWALCPLCIKHRFWMKYIRMTMPLLTRFNTIMSHGFSIFYTAYSFSWAEYKQLQIDHNLITCNGNNLRKLALNQISSYGIISSLTFNPTNGCRYFRVCPYCRCPKLPVLCNSDSSCNSFCCVWLCFGCLYLAAGPCLQSISALSLSLFLPPSQG